MKRLTLFAAATIIVVVSVVIFFNTDLEKSTQTTSATSEIQSVYQSSYDELVTVAGEALQQLNPVRLKTAELYPHLSEEYVSLTQLAEEYQKGLPLSDWENFREGDNEKSIQAVKDIQAATRTAVHTLQARTEKWAAEVDSLMAAPEDETSEQRIERLQNVMNQPFDYMIGECRSPTEDEYILGCYTPGDSHYIVTAAGLETNDCVLKQTLAHEYRHYQQWVEGLTSQWSEQQLEFDAREHESLAGC